MALSEFSIINRFFKNISMDSENIRLGIGDDCALMSLGSQEELAVSMDVLNESVHFPKECEGALVAARALRVNLSDLAAMGATPIGFSLGLSLPSVDEQWLNSFSVGLKKTSEQFSCPIVGGDTTHGPLSICIQVFGKVKAQRSLKRSGARSGDGIFVTGTIGDAHYALDVLKQLGMLGNEKKTDSSSIINYNQQQQEYLLSRYYYPEPRLAIAQQLQGIATACIDISDGLLGDLGHICRSSGVKAEVQETQIPFSSVLENLCLNETGRVKAITGGDDYELCFTASLTKLAAIEKISATLGLPVHCIGEITQGNGVELLDRNNIPLSIKNFGYQHFG